MEEQNIDLQQFPEPLRSLVQNMDLKALENLKNSLEKDKVNNMVNELLKLLQQAMPAKEHQILTSLIDSLKLQKNQE